MEIHTQGKKRESWDACAVPLLHLSSRCMRGKKRNKEKRHQKKNPLLQMPSLLSHFLFVTILIEYQWISFSSSAHSLPMRNVENGSVEKKKMKQSYEGRQIDGEEYIIYLPIYTYRFRKKGKDGCPALKKRMRR